MTPMQKLISQLAPEQHGVRILAEKLLEDEKRQMIDLILIALDEDGHTGQWRRNFAEEQYNKLSLSPVL